MTYRAAVITVSDRVSRGERVDGSGPLAKRLLEEQGLDVIGLEVVPDEKERIVSVLKKYIDKENPMLVITTGGTGFMPRDVTPEATLSLIDRRAPGVEEEIRRAGVTAGIPSAMLGRGVSGLCGMTWIVNLPGSEGAVRDGLEAIRSVIGHGLKHAQGISGHHD